MDGHILLPDQSHPGHFYPASHGSTLPFVVKDPVHPVPDPPPMTRELLYRAVFNQIDTERKGWITPLDLHAAMKHAGFKARPKSEQPAGGRGKRHRKGHYKHNTVRPV